MYLKLLFFYHSNVSTIVAGAVLSIDQCVVRVNVMQYYLKYVFISVQHLYSQLYTCNDIYMFHEGGG